ncbi:MAG: 6-carboxytetrahydropterin synthase [Bacteroidetes bacterium]|nr:6-carboxytetrahydropterin synthase [Bacteroidota bacterium]
MNTVRLTKEFRFEGAHALKGYQGKCRHLHGHSYRLRVSVSGIPNDLLSDPINGMVMDFRTLKELVHNLIIEPFDHALLLRNDAPLTEALTETYQNVLVFPFQPTCERLCLHFAALLAPAIPPPARLFSLRLYETSNSFAEWFATDNL